MKNFLCILLVGALLVQVFAKPSDEKDTGSKPTDEATKTAKNAEKGAESKEGNPGDMMTDALKPITNLFKDALENGKKMFAK